MSGAARAVKTRAVKERAKRWTLAQARGVVERWRASGKSASEYAREQGIGETRLWYWSKQVDANTRRDTPQFVAVSIPPSGTAATARTTLEIDVGTLTVRVGEHVDVAYVARLISALHTCSGIRPFQHGSACPMPI